MNGLFGRFPPEEIIRLAIERIGLDGHEARRCIASALDWLNSVPTAGHLVATVRRYPLPPRPERGVRERIRPPLDTPDPRPIAEAILAARPFASPSELAEVQEIDVEILAQLFYVGCQLAPAPPPAPVVGVLLPLRLETRFSPPNGLLGWRLRVRIVPDVPSADRHDPQPSEVELDSTERMWRTSAGDLNTDQGRAEWARFAARHGAARAAWLARTFPPIVVGGEITISRPAVTRTEPHFNRVVGLPPTLELWLARSGNPPAQVATLSVDRTALQLDFPDPTSGVEPWWSSFARAKAVGLGCEIDLGARADDLDALYIIGLGGGDPATVFEAHRDSGSLSVLPLGVPTNTVDGEPAADLARDPETWRRLVVAGPASEPGTELVSIALTGKPSTLAPLPGGINDATALNRALVSAVWTAVFGHGLKDVLGLGQGAHEAGVWALDNLVPEGPVPPIRLGEQPFAILPVTSLAAWRPTTDDPPVEEAIRPSLLALRSLFAKHARARGTVVGADTERLLELLAATPNSTAYSWRWFLPLQLMHALGWAYGSGTSWSDQVAWWDSTAAEVLGFPVRPGPRYETLGFVQDLAIPLVVPDNLPAGQRLGDILVRLAGLDPKVLVGAQRELFDRLPNSLLIRLVLHSLIVTAAEVARDASGLTDPLLEPPYVATTIPSVLASWAQQWSAAQLGGAPSSRLFQAAREGAISLAGIDPVEIERAFRATLDTASHRIDPWVTGLAWRRLRSLSTPRFDLGAYGWVDAPSPAAAGSAFPAEFLHAPSQEQALTAAILRDRALSDAEPGRWDMDLDSDRVRLAEQLAAEVRLGAHLSEALGRAVERAIGNRATVEQLRRDHPIRIEHAGRRVCDGLAVLATLATDPASLGLTQAQEAALGPLAEALDTYGDLLVADAAFDIVSGRAERAGASMEAAVGLSVPPNLDVIRTQRQGRSVTTSVVVALPDATAPATVDATTSPGRIADPAVAAFLDTAFGAASGPAWTWQALDGDGNVLTSVTLADLDLAPIDTIGLSADDLASAVREATGAASVTPAAGPAAHKRTRRLADVLGSQPAVPADLADGPSPPSDAAVHADLLARYTTLQGAASALDAALQAAVSGSETDRLLALASARRWGITPLALDGESLEVRTARAGESLATRLAAAPTVAAAGDATVPDLARALAELAAAEGRLPILARHRLDTLPVSLTAEPAPTASRQDLDPDWLEVVSAVRRPVARLEAYQWEQRTAGSSAFAAWSNRPGDPWQATLPAGSIAGLVPSTRLVAAFGPSGVLNPGTDPTRRVAVGLVDSFSETIPATEHGTSVAFHFDAPAARAAQAILVAVPPQVDVPLDTQALVEIVAETRDATHARMATPAELDLLAAALPLTMVPANPPAGVSLFPD
jgi:hypothetical protein